VGVALTRTELNLFPVARFGFVVPS